MSFNKDKVNKNKMIQLILNEYESIEEKCEGYRREILDAIIEILKAEKEHNVQRTTIQKQVDTACHKVGDFLHRTRDTNPSTTEAAK